MKTTLFLFITFLSQIVFAFTTEELQDLHKISMKKEQICLIDDENLKCWGGEGEFSIIGDTYIRDILPMKTPDMVSVDINKACMIIEKEAYCFNSGYTYIDQFPLYRRISAVTSLLQENEVYYKFLLNYIEIANERRSDERKVPKFTKDNFAKEYRQWNKKTEDSSDYNDFIGNFWGEVIYFKNNLLALLRFAQASPANLTLLSKTIKEQYDRENIIPGQGKYLKTPQDLNLKNIETSIYSWLFNYIISDTLSLDDLNDAIREYNINNNVVEYTPTSSSAKLEYENVSFITTNNKATCLITDSRLKCFDDLGELYIPKKFSNPKMVAIGERHSCALDDKGVQCWGDNTNGELDVPNLINPYYISTQRFHTCALDEQGVKCWGYPNNGRTNPPSSITNPQLLSVGGKHACVINKNNKNKNEVICWGDNRHGQTNIPSDLINPSFVIAKDNKTCTIDSMGLYCWGEGTESDLESYLSTQAGLSCSEQKNSREQCEKENTFGHLSTYHRDNGHFSSGEFKYCEYRIGCLSQYCNSRGCDNKVLNPISSFSFSSFEKSIALMLKPYEKEPNLTLDQKIITKKFTGEKLTKNLIKLSGKLALGEYHQCILAEEGLLCEGNIAVTPFVDKEVFPDLFIERGEGHVTFEKKDYVGKFIKIASGQSEICALDEGNTLHCWGDHQYYTIEDVKDFDVGSDEVCLIKTDGRAKCHNDFVHQVVRYNRDIKNASQIVVGRSHACALDEGKVKCWGSNDSGQIDIPEEMISPYFLSTARNHTCALAENGLFCWGSNEYGQSTVRSDIKKENISFLSVGSWHTCINIQGKGSKCWGYNKYKQTDIPKKYQDDLVFSGRKRSCALNQEGLHCWSNDNDDRKFSIIPFPTLTDQEIKGSCYLKDVYSFHYYGYEPQLHCPDETDEVFEDFICLLGTDKSTTCSYSSKHININMQSFYEEMMGALGNNDYIFERIIAGSYKAERSFLTQLQKIWGKTINLTQEERITIDLFTMKILEVFVRQNNSTYFIEEIIPYFDYLNEGVNEANQVNNENIFKYKIRALQLILQRSKDFLSQEELENIEILIKEIAEVYRNPSENQIASLKALIIENEADLHIFDQSPKLRFISKIVKIIQANL